MDIYFRIKFHSNQDALVLHCMTHIRHSVSHYRKLLSALYMEFYETDQHSLLAAAKFDGKVVNKLKLGLYRFTRHQEAF